jgi:hypothetical protein
LFQRRSHLWGARSGLRSSLGMPYLGNTTALNAQQVSGISTALPHALWALAATRPALRQ